MRALDYIRANTTLTSPPLVPEVRLYLADDPISLWELTEQQIGGRELAAPFWAFAWPGGVALARYLLDHPEQVAGRTVLDLAAGSGLVAIAAARAGAARVTASDVDPLAVAAMALNARANGVTVMVVLGDLLAAPEAGASEPGGAEAEGAERGGSQVGGAERGGSPAGAAEAAAAETAVPDLVLAGDACYERLLAKRVLAFLRRASDAGAEVLLGDPGRAYLPRTGFAAVAAYDVPVLAGIEDTSVRHTTVWRPG